ncbi:ABC transporter ATP-binding protein [Roseomonas sp. AR75]|uniref:ABC transporter ATP-binding protein n=1 Tax=Roseomonas sp. AR75 TaxID=2562311 RepID=UPI001F0D757C|nr:ABC transporter ATP-binding protein [Roseomonas sp. AR75]
MLLEARDLTKNFGGVRALDGAGFAIAEPGIVGLIGPNGAGKTTLFDMIAGRQTPDAGHVLLDGRDVTALPPERRAALGLARTFQECRVFPEWTLRENLLFAARPRSFGSALLRAFTRREALPNGAAARAEDLLRLATLDAYADAPASILSFGQRRMLEIASALMTRPRWLLLDEPAAGINPGLLDALGRFLRQAHADQGGLFLIVEHNMEFIMGLAGRIIVMHQGAVLADGPPEAVQSDAAVIEAYLG